MYSHSCSCLHDRNQPAFTGSISQNLDIMRTFSTKSFSSNFEKHTETMHLPVDADVSSSLADVSNSSFSEIPNLPTRASSITGFPCNFVDGNQKFKIRSETCNFSSLERTRSNCRNYFSQYDYIATMPLVSSHLVGGFVGSKSQLGRRQSSHGIGVNMWDIVREVFDYFGSSKSMPEKKESEKASLTEVKCVSQDIPNCNKLQPLALNQRTQNNHSSFGACDTVKGENLVRVPKQSYADVAKARLPSNENPYKIVHEISSEQRLRCPQSKPKSFAEISSAISNRDRIASECSTDSEDSFIVFECDTDDKSEYDDNSSSDDESAMESQTSSAEGSPVVNTSEYSRHCGLDEFNFDRTEKPNRKKVRFAEGPSMVKVHTMFAWDYAYRAARRGPWKTWVCDSERFKRRIRDSEILLGPVLDGPHRAAVYSQRFADPAETK